jgi:hypothetical protein
MTCNTAIWETSGDIPDEVVSAAINFAQEIAISLGESFLAEEVTNNVFASIHPGLPKRVTLDLLLGKGNAAIIRDVNHQGDILKINAIRAIRIATGFPLREAKIVSEDVMERGERWTLPSTITRAKREELRQGLAGTGWRLT